MGLYSDAENPSKYIETFTAESWEEHLRQHERITVADREIENSVKSFEKNPPIVSHWVFIKKEYKKKYMNKKRF